MYTWKLDVVLKSGKEITVYYNGSENNSGIVADKLLAGSENEFNGFSNEDGTKNVFIKVGEIAAASISVA